MGQNSSEIGIICVIRDKFLLFLFNKSKNCTVQAIQMRSDWAASLLCAYDCLSVIYKSLRHGFEALIWSCTSSAFYFLGLLRHCRISPTRSGVLQRSKLGWNAQKKVPGQTHLFCQGCTCLARKKYPSLKQIVYLGTAPSCFFLATLSYFLFSLFLSIFSPTAQLPSFVSESSFFAFP